MTLRVVNKETLLNSIEAEQQKIKEELQQTLKLQQTANEQVAELVPFAERLGKLTPEQLERLQSADIVQKRVKER